MSSLPRPAHDPAPLAVTIGETVDELLRRHELDQANDRQWLELGRKLGYTQGYAAAEADMDAEWAALAEKVRSYSYMATQDELRERRGEGRCQRGCRQAPDLGDCPLPARRCPHFRDLCRALDAEGAA